ncbi:uncharacterized protein LOC110983954 [Acanthaster planci]|uniref:Uncharacterized protein LOC110983954 n=1 Tax=Acanthaster planci TaxID=133434 RepID=A0A8B7Z7U6_ACAPL|nr:uncharacterized protein LOC110983954 [Acanthaster planci]
MSRTQQDTASLIVDDTEHVSREETPAADSLRSLLDSDEAQSLLFDLMSDDRLLAQVSGLTGEDNGGEMGRNAATPPRGPYSGSSCPLPVPSLQQYGSEVQALARQEPHSPVEARAPFTPTLLPAAMRWDALDFQRQAAYTQIPSHYSQKDNHPYPSAVPEIPQQPYQCQILPSTPPLPPVKKVFLGNKRQPKTIFTNEQLELLEMTFATSHYPSSVLRTQLSYVSQLPVKTIQTWFQNRRVRYRRRLGKISKQRRQRQSLEASFGALSPVKSLPDLGPGSNGGSPWHSESATAQSSPEYMLVFPPSQGESCLQAGQLSGPQLGFQPNQQGVANYGWQDHSQLAGGWFPDRTTPLSDQYLRTQQADALPSRWVTTSPEFCNSSNDNPSTRGYQHFPQKHPGDVPTPLPNLRIIYPKPPQPSAGSNQQHPVASPLAASHHPLPPSAMLSQYQPHPISPQPNRYHQPATPCMMQSQSSVPYQYHTPLLQQGTDSDWMHPQCSPHPQDTHHIPSPNPTLQSGFPGAFPQQEPPSYNIRGLPNSQGYPEPKAVPKNGFSSGYPTVDPTLCYYSGSHHQLQINHPSFSIAQSRTSNQSDSDSSTSMKESSPCPPANEYTFTPLKNKSVSQGALTDKMPTDKCSSNPAAQPVAPGMVPTSSGDPPPPGQLVMPKQPTPVNLVHACNQPLASSADEPSVSPCSPESACSFGSCTTLYIDLDAEID